MINVLICVGVYHTEQEIKANSISYQLPQVPETGNIIIPNAQLQQLINKKLSDWNMDSGTRINYVKNVAYMGNNIVVMLSSHPDLISIDCFFKDKTVGTYAQAVPNVGDGIYVSSLKQDEWLWVKRVYHNKGIVTLDLVENQPVPAVQFINDEIDVNVQNTVDVDICNSSQSLDVNIVGQRNTLDVRTRKEAWD